MMATTECGRCGEHKPTLDVDGNPKFSADQNGCSRCAECTTVYLAKAMTARLLELGDVEAAAAGKELIVETNDES